MTTPPTDARDGAQVPQEDADLVEKIAAILYETGPSATWSEPSLRWETLVTSRAIEQHRAQAREVVRRIGAAALATPPAPDRTLAELVDAAKPSNLGIDITVSMHDLMGVISFLWDEHGPRLPYRVSEQHDRLVACAKARALEIDAYQPPAPVSRAGAVEMVSEMIYRRVVTPILGGSDWEHDPKSENRLQCEELALRIVAALAAAEGRA